MKEKKQGITRWIYWFLLGVAIIIVYKTLDNFGQIKESIGNLFNVLEPFIIGLLIAYLLYIPCKKLEQFYKKSKKVKFINKKARLLSVVTIYIIVITVIALTLNFVLPAIAKSIIDLVNNFQTYYNSTINSINNLPENFALKNDIINAIENIQNIDLKQFINLEKLTQYAKGAINIVSGVFNIFVAFIVSIYLLLEREEILNFMKKLTRVVFKKETYQNIDNYFNKSNEIFFKFLSSQLLDAVVVGILTSIAMSLLGVKYALLLGFIIGLFNLIPYFGAIIAVIIAIVVTLFTGGFGQAFLMAVIVIILQQIDANIINPKIVGSSLKISPLLVIFAVTVGGAYFGVLGMFLAVPIVAILKILISDYIEYKNKIKNKEEIIE